MRFEFGQNWKRFVDRHFSEERVEMSRQHLLNFLGREDLKGVSFLDIGCGSGLHSLAAIRSGAAKVVSFDFDPIAVETTQRLRSMEGSPASWEVRQGSILDAELVESLEPVDLVYSWGVLHHTGEMWTAMDNAARLIGPRGQFYVALYDYDAQKDPTPEFWLELKQRYNRSSWLGRRRLEYWYIWDYMLKRRLRALPRLVRTISGYRESRGMAFYTDLRDWLGGWPMEFARRQDVLDWGTRHELTLESVKTGEANSEFLFRKGNGRR